MYINFADPQSNDTAHSAISQSDDKLTEHS